MALTGRYRFRQAWSGIILEVEHGYNAMWPYERDVRYGTEWKRARAEDLYDIALRPLINGDCATTTPHGRSIFPQPPPPATND